MFHNPTPKATTKSWLGLAALMLPVLLVSIDNTVLSFALGEISQSLTPTGKQLLWIVDIYPLILAGLLVPMGTLGDRLGRRKLLLIGAAGFGLVSVYAAFSPTAEHLIAARALLGVFGATLMPSTLALLRNLFHDTKQRRLAIAIWASGFSAGAALGPIAGGWLLEHYWWGSVFLMNVPVLLIMLIASPFLLPESKDPHPGKLDGLGVILAILTMLALVYGVKSFATGGQLALSLGSLGLSAAAGALFVRRQLHTTYPLLDMKLFKIPLFSTSIISNLMSIVAMAGMLFFLAQYLQLVLGYSPLTSGYFLLPGLLATIVMGLLAVKLANIVAVQILIPIGLTFSAIGFGFATQIGAHTSVWLLVTSFTLVGAGVGLAETLTNDAILAAVPPHKAGAASGISETAYELGALLGTAILGSVLTATYRNQLIIAPTVSPADTAVARETLGGAIEVATTLDNDAGAQLTEAARQAFSHGADLTATVGAVIMVLTAVGVAIALRKTIPTTSADS